MLAGFEGALGGGIVRRRRSADVDNVDVLLLSALRRIRSGGLTEAAKTSASVSYGFAASRPCFIPQDHLQPSLSSPACSLSMNFCAEAMDREPTAVMVCSISNTPRVDGSTSRSYGVNAPSSPSRARLTYANSVHIPPVPINAQRNLVGDMVLCFV